MIVRNASGGGGVKLPALTNPADAGKIIAGYEAIDGKGAPFTGSLGAGITNPAGAGQIFNGYEAIGKSGDLLKGVAGAGITSPATAAKIALGFQALDKAGNLLTGTMVPYYVNTSSLTVPRDSRAQTFTCTATGSEVVMAIVWRPNYDGEKLSGVGTLWGSAEARVSFASIFTKISYSGSTVTVSIDSDDAYKNDVWNIWVLSK